MSGILPEFFDGKRILWKPLAGSQTLAITSPARETLFQGTRGGGKTDVQIMMFAKYVGKGYGKFWRGIIFDREYKNLDDLVSRTKRWFKEIFGDDATFLENKADYKWKWKTGEELLIRSIKDEEDYQNYHGQEFPFIGWNELTKYPNAKLYESMMSCNRSSFTPEINAPRDRQGRPIVGKIPLMIFSTTNPWGSGRSWVKRRFIDPAPYGTLIKETIDVINPKTRKVEPFVTTKVAIFSHFMENPFLEPEYIAGLIADSNENQRKAWLEGDWNAAAGGAFEDVYLRRIHVVENFRIPAAWTVFRAFDWGSSHPFYVGWFAETNGEEVILPSGLRFAPAAGSLVCFYEWYGVHPKQPNVGIKLGARSIAKGILEREREFFLRGITAGQAVTAGAADGQIYNKINTDNPTIADDMKREGVTWIRADKSQGSRINGLELLRDRFKAATKGEGRAIYMLHRCGYAIDLVPTVPYDLDNIEDVDTSSEDHPYDVFRYMALFRAQRYLHEIKVKYPT